MDRVEQLEQLAAPRFAQAKAPQEPTPAKRHLRPKRPRFNRRGVNLIAEFEGFRSCPYRDVVGVWTIGYGTTGNVGPHSPCITEAVAKNWLRRDAREFGREIRRLVRVRLSNNEYSALVSFAYNVGAGAFASSTLLRLLNEGKRQAAADQFGQWVYAGGQVYQGLVRRREAERELFLRRKDPR